MSIGIIAINENTWRLEEGFVRFFLLKGTEKALMIDSGANCPEARTIAESLTDLPLMLLNTHGDGDHTSGNGAFSAFYMTREDYENCGLQAKFPQSDCIPLQDGEVIDLGNRTLEIITIPGHTYGSVAVLDVESRMLFSGDSIQAGQIYMFGKHRNPGAFAAGLEKLMACSHRFDTVFPAHGTPELPAAYIAKVLAVWQDICSGKLTPTRQEVHGNPVDSYTAEACGFYCTPKSAV